MLKVISVLEDFLHLIKELSTVEFSAVMIFILLTFDRTAVSSRMSSNEKLKKYVRKWNTFCTVV